MSDYAELVERLEVLAAWHKPAGDEPTIRPTNKYKAFVDAADAIKALVQERDKEHERAEKFKWQVRDTCARAEKAESALAECMAHATDLANDLEMMNAEPFPSVRAFHQWRAKQ